MAKKGRTSFTIAEIKRLHQLFIEKDQTTDQDERKAIRTKMRRIPSSSNARSMSFEDKLQEWKNILK